MRQRQWRTGLTIGLHHARTATTQTADRQRQAGASASRQYQPPEILEARSRRPFRAAWKQSQALCVDAFDRGVRRPNAPRTILADRIGDCRTVSHAVNVTP
jgi:hypothetical protein